MPEQRTFHEPWDNYGKDYPGFSASDNIAIVSSPIDLKSGISKQELDRPGSKWMGSRFMLLFRGEPKIIQADS